VPALTAGGLLVLVWATVAGPARIIGAPHVGLAPHRPPPPTAPPTTPPSGKSLAQLRHDYQGVHHLGWVGDLLAWTALLLIALALLAGVVWLWRHRWHRPEPPLDTPVQVLPTADVAEALEQGAAERLDAIGRGSPRNAIVACWLLVEEAIAAAGLPRLPWETSTEFTVRVLHRMDIDPRIRNGVNPVIAESSAREHKSVNVHIVHHGQFEIAVERCAGDGLPHTAPLGAATCLGIDVHHRPAG